MFYVVSVAEQAGLGILYWAHFKYFQVQTHVQTAHESPDLNMDFVHLTV